MMKITGTIKNTASHKDMGSNPMITPMDGNLFGLDNAPILDQSSMITVPLSGLQPIGTVSRGE